MHSWRSWGCHDVLKAAHGPFRASIQNMKFDDQPVSLLGLLMTTWSAFSNEPKNYDSIFWGGSSGLICQGLKNSWSRPKKRKTSKGKRRPEMHTKAKWDAELYGRQKIISALRRWCCQSRPYDVLRLMSGQWHVLVLDILRELRFDLPYLGRPVKMIGNPKKSWLCLHC